MSKKLWMMFLFLLDALLIISGVFYSYYSLKNGLTFMVYYSKIPTYVFGLATVYIGIRYLKGIMRLRKAINKDGVSFSWNNFKLKGTK